MTRTIAKIIDERKALLEEAQGLLSVEYPIGTRVVWAHGPNERTGVVSAHDRTTSGSIRICATQDGGGRRWLDVTQIVRKDLPS